MLRFPAGGREIVFPKQGQQPINLAPAAGHDERWPCATEAIQNGEGFAERRPALRQADTVRRLAWECHHGLPRIVQGSDRLHGQTGPGASHLYDCIPGHVELIGCRVRGLCRPSVPMVGLFRLFPELLRLFGEDLRLIQHQDRRFGEIVEQGLQALIDLGASPLCIRWKGCQRARMFGRVDQLAGREQPGLGERGRGLLRSRVEDAHRLDGVTEKFHPQWIRVGGRIDIHDAASHAELAGDLHG